MPVSLLMLKFDVWFFVENRGYHYCASTLVCLVLHLYRDEDPTFCIRSVLLYLDHVELNQKECEATAGPSTILLRSTLYAV